MVTEEKLQELLYQHYRGFIHDQGEIRFTYDLEPTKLARAIYDMIDYHDFVEGGC